MPVGLVSDEDFELERALIIDRLPSGRKEGDRNVPDAVRKIIADEAITNGNDEAKKLARFFGVSNSSVSAYKNDAVSTASYDKPNEELALSNKATRNKLQGKALSKLESAIDALTDEKLQMSSAIQISSVVKNMSGTFNDLNDKGDGDKGINPGKFIIYAPIMMKDNEFKTVIVNDVE